MNKGIKCILIGIVNFAFWTLWICQQLQWFILSGPKIVQAISIFSVFLWQTRNIVGTASKQYEANPMRPCLLEILRFTLKVTAKEMLVKNTGTYSTSL